MGILSLTSIGGIVIDMILISILVSTTYKGYRDGLVGVAFKIIIFVVALLIAFIFYKPVSQMVIDQTDWDEKLTVAIERNLKDVIIDEEGNVIDNPNSNISSNLIDFINKIVKESVNNTKVSVISFVSSNLAMVMIRYGTMVVLFVFSNIVLSFLRSIFELVASLPFIRLFNRGGGIIYGVIKGFLIAYFILAILSVLSPLISRWGIIKMIQEAYFASRMYNNNILLNVIF